MSDTVPGTESGFAIGQAHEVLDALIRYAGDCVHVVDLDGRVLRWNSACEELHGWAARDVLGEVLPFVSRARRRRVIQDIRMLAGHDAVGERVGVTERPDGSRVRVRMAVIPLHDEDGDPSGVLVVSREVLSDERLDRQRAEFASYIGEGLAGPLHVIANAASLLARPEVAEDPVRRHRLATALQANARNAGAFVDDLLTTSLIARGELVLDREPVDLSDLVAGVVSTLGDDARRVVLDFDPTVPRTLVDTARVSRAVGIVVREALDAATARGQVHVSVVPESESINVIVRVGGTAAVAPRDSDGRQRSADAGLADHLVRGIVEAHGGTITRSSGPDAPGVTLVFPTDRQSIGAEGRSW